MAIELQLATHVSVPEVLAALRDLHGRSVPAPLERWTRGSARSVVAKVRGPRFRLWYKRAWHGPEYDPLEVRGSVDAGPDGGAVVRARARQKLAGPITAVVFLAGSATWVTVSGGSGWWWIVGILGAILLLTAGLDTGVWGGDDEAKYLIECVELAVAEAARDSSIHAPTA
jgi:hypothetical protein